MHRPTFWVWSTASSHTKPDDPYSETGIFAFG